MKLLVIGGSGLIVSHLIRVAQAGDHSVLGTYHQHSLVGLRRLDASNHEDVRGLLDVEKPDAVVNAAGWSWVDGCEDNSSRAFAENAEHPARVAELCRQRRIKFAFFSSSYVFNGVSGPYTETDPPAPINVYGRSKLEGERLIREANSDALVLRVICVYGIEHQQKNFAYQVLRAMRAGDTLTLPADQEGNPTYAGDIARWVLALFETKASGGIWHLAGRNPACNRVQWAQEMVECFQASGVKASAGFSIQSKPTVELKQRAMRPLKAGLICRKVVALGIEPTDLSTTLSELL